MMRTRCFTMFLAVLTAGLQACGGGDSGAPSGGSGGAREGPDAGDLEDAGGLPGAGGSPALGTGGAVDAGGTPSAGGSSPSGGGGGGGGAGSGGEAVDGGGTGGQAGTGGARTICNNSLDCPTGQVCQAPGATCVDCLTDADCEEGHKCGLSECHRACASDETCTPIGQLCDTLFGYCVECLRDTDCALDDFCIGGGTCWPDQCSPGTSVCAPNNRRAECVANGAGYDTPVDCPFGSTCAEEGSTATCEQWVCQPGVQCDFAGNRVVHCTEDGLEVLGIEECAADEVCPYSGACARVVCTANEYRCDGETLKRCDSYGTEELTEQTCDATQVCETAFGGACYTKICTPNERVCENGYARTCNDKGYSYVSDEDCRARGATCVNGACEPIVCNPSTSRCENGVALRCSGDGTEETRTECVATEFCDDTDSSGATCRTVLCQPGEPWCNYLSAEVCNATGSGSADDTTSTYCPDVTEYCVNGACVAGAPLVEDVGASATVMFDDHGVLRLNRYEVTQARTLVRIGTHLQLTGPTGVNWYVFERAGTSPRFDQLIVLGTSEPAGSSMRESPTLSIPLRVGHEYAIGFYVQWANAVYSAIPAGPSSLSFGQGVGSESIDANLPLPLTFRSGVDSPSATTVFALRLSTLQ